MYSTTERKIGKFFNDDLYEKSFNIASADFLDNTATVEIDGADKIINAVGFLINSIDNITKRQIDSVTAANNTFINTVMYDYESEESIAAVSIARGSSASTYDTGVIKVQYTKLTA